MNNRSALYKNEGKDAATMRKNRTEHALTLRKEKREENMAKRRNIPQEYETDLQDADLEPITLPQLIANTKSQDPNVRRQAFTRARKMLSSEESPPIDEFINNGLLPILVEGLKSNDATLQLEAAWSLTNIASGTSEQTNAVFRAGAVPHFLDLLYSDNMDLCDQAIWALGNIIGDGPHFRDYCIEIGIIQPLIKLVRPDISLEFLRNVTWVLVNLCRYKDPPLPVNVFASLFPSITQLLHHEDTSVLIDSLWALIYTSDASAEYVQAVIDHGLVKHIIPLLTHTDQRVLSAALRCVGNLATGTDSQTQVLLDHGVLEHMLPLLSYGKTKTTKEATWFLSNITAGNVDQIQAVINANLVPKLIELLSSGDFLTQKEAVWAVTNVTISGSFDQILYVFENGAVEPLCSLLHIGDPQIVRVILEGLLSILKKLPDHYSRISDEIEECGGLEEIEYLQNHENDEIYKLAYFIIDEFFTDAQEGNLDEHEGFKYEKSQEPFDQYKF